MKSISRLYTFIDNKHGFTAHFIEGHKLIDEVTEIHNIGPKALEFYKKTILTSEQMTTFLKPGEHLGFYIDSEEPYFRFKIEMGQMGDFRTLLLPEEFEDFPSTFTGNCRVHKMYQSKAPYTSLLQYQDHLFENLVNDVIEKSYQSNSKVIVAKDSCSSIMFTKLPPVDIKKDFNISDDMSLDQYISHSKALTDKLFSLKYTNVADVEKVFEKSGLIYLGSREIKFKCHCSKDRMIDNISALNHEVKMDLFKTDKTIETRCDYCNTTYSFTKSEIVKAPLQ